MKTVAKVFIILSMVVFPIAFVILLIFAIFYGQVTAEILGDGTTQEQIDAIKLILTIYTIVIGVGMAISETVGGIALSKLKTATSKSQLTAIGVVTLLLCSLLGGIFMLCIPDTEFQPSNSNYHN